MPSPIFITALHFVNFAPIDSYSFSLSSRPSKPMVRDSSDSPIDCSPLSTFIPGSAPWLFITSSNEVPSLAFCLIVSSKRMTPPMLSFIPDALKSISL